MACGMREEYRKLAKKGKSNMSRDLVQAIRDLTPPGRFIKRNPVTNAWEDVGDDIAREKVSQALRDALSEHCGPKAEKKKKTSSGSGSESDNDDEDSGNKSDNNNSIKSGKRDDDEEEVYEDPDPDAQFCAVAPAMGDLVPAPFDLSFDLSLEVRTVEGADGGDTASLLYYKDWVERTLEDLDSDDAMKFLLSELNRLEKEQDEDVARNLTYIQSLLDKELFSRSVKEVADVVQVESGAAVKEHPQVVKDTTPTRSSRNKSNKLWCALLLLCCPFGMANRRKQRESADKADAQSVGSDATENERDED